MYKEVNTGTNLPAQIDLYSVDGDEYKFLCMAKGGRAGRPRYQGYASSRRGSFSASPG
jgi:tartrate dehydratase alpha subunit/fumarate hydratase class I-like protein